MSEEKKDFVVKDRRIFSEEGQKQADEPKPAVSKDAPETASEKVAAAQAEEKAARDAGKEREADVKLPEINFPTFIFSLNSSALVHLGIIEDPASGQKVKNLPMAKQTIDILGMIEEKTQGNLTADEAGMLKHILYELRIIYVKEKR